jgi:hypothetical protein
MTGGRARRSDQTQPPRVATLQTHDRRLVNLEPIGEQLRVLAVGLLLLDALGFDLRGIAHPHFETQLCRQAFEPAGISAGPHLTRTCTPRSCRSQVGETLKGEYRTVANGTVSWGAIYGSAGTTTASVALRGIEMGIRDSNWNAHAP